MKKFIIAALTLMTSIVHAEDAPEKSQFVSTKLPGGMTLDIPKGWSFTGPDQKQILQTYAQSIWDLTKIPYGRAGMLLGATAPPDTGYFSVTIVIEYRKTATQQDVKQIPSSQLPSLDKQNRDDIEAGSPLNGLKILSWEGTTVERVGSTTAIIKRYTYQLPGQKPRRMENCQIFLGDRMMSLILQNGEQTLIPAKPIFERIKSSVKIE